MNQHAQSGPLVRTPLSGRSSGTIDPGLKPWAMIYNRFAVLISIYGKPIYNSFISYRSKIGYNSFVSINGTGSGTLIAFSADSVSKKAQFSERGFLRE